MQDYKPAGVYELFKIIRAKHPEWTPLLQLSRKVSAVYGPVMVTHETNSSIVVNAWSGALEKIMVINKALPPQLATWLYYKESIQGLWVQGTMGSHTAHSRNVLLLNGRSQMIDTPKNGKL